MELSYYFCNQLENRKDIDDFLLGLMKGVTDEGNELNIERREESEAGEGDTLDFSCKFFSVSTNLHWVQNISEEYHMKVNFGLRINIYRGGVAKFIEFIGQLLNETKGEAILLEGHSSTVLERRGNTLIVNNYFFDGDFNNLGIMYLNGIYKNFDFHITVNHHIEDLKSKLLDMVKEYIGEQSISFVEDEDTDYVFEIGSDYFKVFVHLGKISKNNVCEVMDLEIGIIYPNTDYTRLTIMINLLKRILKEFEGNCQLSIRKGYLLKDYKEYVIMERDDGIISINENAEEKSLFYEIGIS